MTKEGYIFRVILLLFISHPFAFLFVVFGSIVGIVSLFTPEEDPLDKKTITDRKELVMSVPIYDSKGYGYYVYIHTKTMLIT